MKLWIASVAASLFISSMHAIEARKEYVILLHGLCRTSASMQPMERFLKSEGFTVLNVAYPSRTASIEVLSEAAIGGALKMVSLNEGDCVHFVTHSLGAILVRSYLRRHKVKQLGRVVMLGPPNGGSEVVDILGDWKLFSLINGPAGAELGTGEDSAPNSLGAADFSLGVIAGDRSINWINSLMIRGADDGKVSVERTKLSGMSDHIVLHATHPFLMRHSEALQQTATFLRTGVFEREEHP